jgi:hypothetical protein
LFYAGSFEVVGDTVTHHVRFATSGDRIGRDMVRKFSIENDLLHISAEGDYGSSVLVWEKIK